MHNVASGGRACNRDGGRFRPDIPVVRRAARVGRSLLRTEGNVERVIILDKKKLAGHWVDLWRQVVGTRWDMVIDIRGSALGYLIPAKRRVVYNRSWETGLRKVEMVSRMMGAPAPYF